MGNGTRRLGRREPPPSARIVVRAVGRLATVCAILAFLSFRYVGVSYAQDYTNTTLGVDALASNIDGDSNTALGSFAAHDNTHGSRNTVTGYQALRYNTIGFDNIAIGTYTMWKSIDGNYNTAVGSAALVWNTTGSYNTALGTYALLGRGGPVNYNTAVGYSALSPTEGDHNVAVGESAANGVLTGSWNIHLGAQVYGQPQESHTIRIGRAYETGTGTGQDKTFIAGIVETPLTANFSVVGIQSDGQLGTLEPDDFVGPSGPVGAIGPQGPAGPGLVPGSLLFLAIGVDPPSGYVLLGTTYFAIQTPAKKLSVLKVNVYQMQ
jgi:hypothetical protein